MARVYGFVSLNDRTAVNGVTYETGEVIPADELLGTKQVLGLIKRGRIAAIYHPEDVKTPRDKVTAEARTKNLEPADEELVIEDPPKKKAKKAAKKA